ncbi:MAG: SDR family NAD(P)-dependent oxidoreductase [Alphaproteobacteria bacterium]|nr:SDR family NAD(P)-dependent oxidoreductase [Alphaproteobacteria bacterium]
MTGRLAGRVALVTGASRGIGAAVALRFAREGAHLILVARTVGGLEDVDDGVRAAGGSATLVPLDVTDGPGIDRLRGALGKRWGRLDILVSNAAILAGLSPVAHVTPERWDRAIAVNLTANWRLIRSLDPLLRASDAGRAIFVTSGIARGAYAYWAPYAASKAGLEALVRSWAAETARTSLRVNILDPGVVRTAMRAEAMPGEDPRTLPEPATLGEDFVALAEPACTRHGEVVYARRSA